MQKQPDTAPIEGVVASDISTVEYWRKRFHDEFAYFRTPRTCAKELAAVTDDVDVLSWENHLKNMLRDKAGLEITKRAVYLMEQIRPKTPAKPLSTRLSRQGLVSPTTK